MTEQQHQPPRRVRRLPPPGYYGRLLAKDPERYFREGREQHAAAIDRAVQRRLAAIEAARRSRVLLRPERDQASGPEPRPVRTRCRHLWEQLTARVRRR